MISLHGDSLCKYMMHMKRIKIILYLDSSCICLLSPYLTIPDVVWITVGHKLFQFYVEDTLMSPLEEV
jgi:hypothetical protein